MTNQKKGCKILSGQGTAERRDGDSVGDNALTDVLYHIHREDPCMKDEINSQNPTGNPDDVLSPEEEQDSDSIVTLVDDEGRMSEFEVLDAIDTRDGRFVALLPLASLNEETGEGEYIILRVVTEDNQEELAEIDDEELLQAVADVFQERFQELYEGEELS